MLLSVFVPMLRFPGADTGGWGLQPRGPFVQNTFFLYAVLRGQGPPPPRSLNRPKAGSSPPAR